MTLLVVGPDTNGSEALLDQLAELGFSVARADNVRAAREAASRDTPELVLVPAAQDFDSAVTELDAIHRALPGIPVAVVSPVEVSKNELLAAVRHGAVDVLEPGGAGDFSVIIENAISRGHQRRLPATTAEQRAAGAETQLRELQRDQRAGRYIQMGMLPPSPMAVDDYRLCHKIFPSLMLSGDFVDYFRISDRHFVFY
ncbi:MAG: hypothetical protein HC809_10255, partial [Gammaproteobacteria bacterium]|nr:hypothetical protein [Gammaproteobacteria bacterium]